MKITAVTPKRQPDGTGMVIVLERCATVETPAYHVVGKATCYWCEEWCWLSQPSHDVIITGEAAGICMECAVRTGVAVVGTRVEPTTRKEES